MMVDTPNGTFHHKTWYEACMEACKCMTIKAIYSVISYIPIAIANSSFWPLEAEFEVLAIFCGHTPDRSHQEETFLFS